MQANYTPLSPLSFMRRSAYVFGEKIAVSDQEGRNFTYAQMYERTCRLANGLQAKLALKPQDKVAILAPNTPEHLEAVNGVPLTQGMLVAINYRLSAREVAYILNHSQSRALLIDHEYLPVVKRILEEETLETVECFIVIPPVQGRVAWVPLGAIDYESFLAEASPKDSGWLPEDENAPISVNYTSGTTGRPKGVVYTHRSAYMNAVCSVMQMQMNHESVYLWTLPMFHCNGWCYVWGVNAVGARHVCVRAVNEKSVVQTIQSQTVSHFCGAPVVLRMVADGAVALGIKRFEHGVRVATAAAPPSPSIIEAMLALNVDVLHVYGLTETYGPVTICEVQPKWKQLSGKDLSHKMARQGVTATLAEGLAVLDKNDQPVPADGETLGEVCMRGNIVMKEYLNNPEATAKALRNGWFHSGDLGVVHLDGYVELRDRSKDIIISGGENISTIEVENALYGHEGVADVAVVSKPDEKWGEVPVAFVTPKAGVDLTQEGVIAFCRKKLAHFKAPKAVFFRELPRTSTGKVQKYLLREEMWKGSKKRIAG